MTTNNSLAQLDLLTWDQYVIQAVPLAELQFNHDYVLLEPSVVVYAGLINYVSVEYRRAMGFELLHSAEIVRYYGSDVDRYDLSRFKNNAIQTLEYFFHTSTSLDMFPEKIISTCKDFGYFLDMEYGKAWCIVQTNQFPNNKLKPRIRPPSYPFLGF